jgi:hypothetical protein
MSITFRRASLACCVALAAASCGKSTPAAPTPSPTPTPAPAATPAPAPAPVNARLACGIGPGTGDGLEEHCPRSEQSFLEDVDSAINRVVQRRPDLFDLNNVRGNGGYFVTNPDGYFKQVVQELGNAGLCAVVDGGGEIAVKSQNSFNDQFSIMISAGYVRRGDSSYRATCAPAWF